MYYFTYCSPDVNGSWRFAHVDVIPAIGIMAFGIYKNICLTFLMDSNCFFYIL